jgi:hypothetical protein
MQAKDGVKKPAKPTIKVDMTKPRDKRPLTGLDIEQWRGETGLNKYDATHALGFRNTNHYNEECRKELLRLETELLLRIYMQYPGPRDWSRFQLPELFDLMYGDYLRPFIGTELETWARVDLAERFTRLFGKSPARQYEWLNTKKEKASSANAFIDVILSKLKAVPDPRTVLENTARQCLALRGDDLDTMYPIPTPSNPPTRAKTGRRRKTKTDPVLEAVAQNRRQRQAAAAKKAPAGRRKAPRRERAAASAGSAE